MLGVRSRLISTVLLAVLAATVLAAEPPPAQSQVSLSSIEAQQREIQRSLSSREGPYSSLDETRRRAVLALQPEVFRLIDKARAAGGLDADDQLQLFNDIKQIEALLVKRNVDDHMVCERVAIAGTRRQQMACMTRDERDRRAESAKSAVMQRIACTTQACIGGD